MHEVLEDQARASEERAIAAAREYIAKHMSMRPSQAVQASLQEQDRRLEERLAELHR